MTGLPPPAGIGALFDAPAELERTFAPHRDSLEGRLAETEIERWPRFPWKRETRQVGPWHAAPSTIVGTDPDQAK